MTASSPRPAGSEPGHWHDDEWFAHCRCDEVDTHVAAPDATGGELREALWLRLAEASKLPWSLVGGTHDREIIDSHGCHIATTGTFPDAALIVTAVNALPALRDLLAERDTLAAQVRAVEGLAEELDAESRAAMARADAMARTEENVRHHTAERRQARVAAHHAADLRRALGTPTTGGGE